MPYSPKAIANEFLNIARAAGEWLTPMKVQKLVYYAHGWHLATVGPALVTSPVEAWRWGPVIRPLYAALAEFGDQPIVSNLQEIVVPPGENRWGNYTLRDYFVPATDAAGQYVLDVVRRVWELYGGYSATQLSKLTHEKDTPWDVVAKHYNYVLPNTPVIPDNVIRDYFRRQALVTQG